MNILSIILLVTIAIWAIAAIIYTKKHKNISGCSGDCSKCSSQCKNKK